MLEDFETKIEVAKMECTYELSEIDRPWVFIAKHHSHILSLHGATGSNFVG